MELQEEEEEEGKAGCFLLLPPLTGQRSTCTYLPDLAYILENVRLSIPATKAERGRNPQTQLVNYMVTQPPPSLLHAYLLSSHKITDNTEYQLSPHLSTKARAKPSKQKTVDPPPRNIIRKNWAQPRHRSYNIPSHPTVPPPTPLLSSPTKNGLFFSETGKGKTLACLQGWKKKTAASLAFKPLRM